MNCPICDAMIYANQCRCGWKNVPASTLEIKKMGAEESNEPIVLDDRILKLKEAAPESNQADYWLSAMKKILKSKVF